MDSQIAALATEIIVKAHQLRPRSEKLELAREGARAVIANAVTGELYQRLKYGVFALTVHEQRDALLVYAAFRLVQASTELEIEDRVPPTHPVYMQDAAYFLGRVTA